MEHTTHPDHTHAHGAECSHPAVQHGDHTDYLHDGHLHFAHGDHVDEHRFEVSDRNPDACTATHACDGHEAGHAHGDGCGHLTLPHADHSDYVVAGHLHRAHGDHCDDHGAVAIR